MFTAFSILVYHDIRMLVHIGVVGAFNNPMDGQYLDELAGLFLRNMDNDL